MYLSILVLVCSLVFPAFAFAGQAQTPAPKSTCCQMHGEHGDHANHAAGCCAEMAEGACKNCKDAKCAECCKDGSCADGCCTDGCCKQEKTDNPAPGSACCKKETPKR